MYDLTTKGYKSLRFEFATGFDSGDPWGSAMEWWFATAEVLYHNGIDLPIEWAFSDSPMHTDEDYNADVDYATSIVEDLLESGEATSDDLLTFGHVLFRYATVLTTAGRSY